MKFKVIRAHEGDQFYNVGDIREANEQDVSHLIGTSLVKAPDAQDNKAAPLAKSKAAKKAPENK